MKKMRKTVKLVARVSIDLPEGVSINQAITMIRLAIEMQLAKERKEGNAIGDTDKMTVSPLKSNVETYYA